MVAAANLLLAAQRYKAVFAFGTCAPNGIDQPESCTRPIGPDIHRQADTHKPQKVDSLPDVPKLHHFLEPAELPTLPTLVLPLSRGRNAPTCPTPYMVDAQ
jgi:hypothetical protein